MSKSFEEFRRKVKNREFAIQNSWRADPKVNQHVPDNVENAQLSALNKNIEEADAIKFFDGYLPIYSQRKYIGGFIVFLKKAVRKLLKIFMGWYIFPIYQRNSHFNGKIVNALSLERDLIFRQRESLDKQQVALQQQGESLDKQQATLQQQGESLDEQRVALQQQISLLNDQREVIRLQQEAVRQLESMCEKLNLEKKALEDQLNQVTKDFQRLTNETDMRLKKIENLPTDDEEFYHCFEERFRGSEEVIKERLQFYIPMLKYRYPDWEHRSFIDVGSGRGEWLDLLREYGAVDYVGVDLNGRQNRICEQRGHRVVQKDCLEYLQSLPENSVDLITGFQIIEHLSLPDLMKLLHDSYRVLKVGGSILFETPNPANLNVGANGFYIDPSHKRPLNPWMLQFFAEWNGFHQVQIIDANPSDQLVSFEDNGLNEEEKEKIQYLNSLGELVYGAQDYAVFAIKE